MLKRKTLALMLAIPMALSVSCKKKETEPSKDTTKRTTQTEETTKETEAPTETTAWERVINGKTVRVTPTPTTGTSATNGTTSGTTTGTSANKEGSNGSDGTMKNINISGNIMRFAGGWSFNQRQGNQLRCANIAVTQGAYYVNTQNLKITGNIFDCTMVQHVMWTWGFGTHTSDTNHPGLTISGNTYYQKAGSLDGRVNRFGCVSGTAYDYAGSTDTLKTAIAKMDTRPTKVAWVNRTDKF